MIRLKSQQEIERIGRSGRIIADFLGEVRPRIQPGVTTGELDRFADLFIRSFHGATPAFKGLYGFPGSVCTSVNEVNRVLKSYAMMLKMMKKLKGKPALQGGKRRKLPKGLVR